MALVDLKTDLKSLKYGQDRQGGGNSGQPYIKNDINNPINILGLDDGFITGGFIGATKSSLTDTLRIGKFLTDTPKGPLFIAKQVGLQLSNPKLEVKTINSVGGLLNSFLTADLGSLTNGALEPTRLYNLGVNTLAQVPVEAFGGHFNRHGLLPVQTDDTKYEAVVTYNNNNKANRLIKLSSDFNLGKKAISKTPIDKFLSKLGGFVRTINNLTGLNIPGFDPADLVVNSYSGGPNSIYGVGNTIINRAAFTADADKIDLAYKQSSQQAGKTRKDNGDIDGVDYSYGLGINNIYQKKSNAINTYSKDIPTDNGTISQTLNRSTLANISQNPIILERNGFNKVRVTSTQPNTDDPINLEIDNLPGVTVANTSYAQYAKIIESRKFREDTYTLGGDQVNAFGIYSDVKNQTEILPDSKGYVIYKNGYNDAIVINKSWQKATRELRVGSGRQDSINLTPIFTTAAGSYKEATVTINGKTTTVNDLVKFQIQSLHTDNPSIADWIVFRAYLGELSDNVDAQWTDIKYAGRGDKFYVYDGFTRKMSVTFKVAALSYDEMKPMYQKLNFLMSNLMPDYENNLMRGPLVRMTIGNYIDGQLAKLDSLSYKVSKDSPWEIAMNDTELILPHIIDVSLGFTPIGSQTRNTNKISSKDSINGTSHIAQNWNGASDNAGEYINPASSSIYPLAKV